MVKTVGTLRQGRMVAVERVEIHGHEARLPVVGVDDLRAPRRAAVRFAQARHRLEPRAAEEDEALAVVPVVAVGGAVELLAIVVVVLGEKVHGHAGGRAAREEIALRLAVAEGDADARHRHVHGLGHVLHAAVLRHEDAHVVAEGGERPRQRTRHVGEPAGLGEGLHLRGHEQDAQPAGHEASPTEPRRIRRRPSGGDYRTNAPVGEWRELHFARPPRGSGTPAR